MLRSGLLQSWSAHLNSCTCLVSFWLSSLGMVTSGLSWPGAQLGSVASSEHLLTCRGLVINLLTLFFFFPSFASEALSVLPALLDCFRQHRGQLRAHAPQHLSLCTQLRLLTWWLHPHEPQLSHLYFPCCQHWKTHQPVTWASLGCGAPSSEPRPQAS